MPLRLPLLPLLPLLAALGCEEQDPTRLSVELVPNPEVNTRDDVAAEVNRLDVFLDAQGGFAGLSSGEGEEWGGVYLVTDFDEDGVLELQLTRNGQDALSPFALEQGSQAGRVITITARGQGVNEGRITALGSSAGTFVAGQESLVEVPFNLVPEFRPLRVLSMIPAQGALVSAPLADLTVQLGGEVREEALEGRVLLRYEGTGEEHELKATTSYIDTAMGRLTNVRLGGCILNGGSYTLVLDTGICSTTDKCLDQLLGVEGAQPFEGQFSVDGADEPPSCEVVEVQLQSCPEQPCEAGYSCDEDEEVCVLDDGIASVPEGGSPCDPSWCRPADSMVCSPSGACVISCAGWGACVDPTLVCDPEIGLCVAPE